MEKIKNNKINKIYKTEEVNSKLNKFLTTNHAKDLAIDIYGLNLNEIYDKYSMNYLKKYHKSEEKIKEFIKRKAEREQDRAELHRNICKYAKNKSKNSWYFNEKRVKNHK